MLHTQKTLEVSPAAMQLVKMNLRDKKYLFVGGLTTCWQSLQLRQDKQKHGEMGVSKNRWFSTQIFHLRGFPLQTIHFVIPLFLETPEWRRSDQTFSVRESITDIHWWSPTREPSWHPGSQADYSNTLPGTNIFPTKALLKMDVLFPRWDMLVPWRVIVPNFAWFKFPAKRTVFC